MTYGTGQRVAFAGLVIGFLMCLSGAIAPFWQKGDISINTVAEIFSRDIPIIGDYKVFKMYGGLWWYCVNLLGETECRAYSLGGDNTVSEWAIRVGCVVNVLLTLLCALAALCRQCCCTGGETICHGIIAFIAGGAGIMTAGVFAGTSKEGFSVTMLMSKFGWAFYVYTAGAAIVTLVSFMLRFASPNNPFTPVIINTVNNVMPNKRYTQMSNEPGTVEETERFTGPPYVQASRPQGRPW